MFIRVLMYSRSMDARVSSRSSGDLIRGFTELRAFLDLSLESFWVNDVRSFNFRVAFDLSTFNSGFNANGVGDCFDIYN